MCSLIFAIVAPSTAYLLTQCAQARRKNFNTRSWTSRHCDGGLRSVVAAAHCVSDRKAGHQQVPRVLKQSMAPVKVVPRDTSGKPALGKEFGLEVPMGTAETALRVRAFSIQLVFCALYYAVYAVNEHGSWTLHFHNAAVDRHSSTWRFCSCPKAIDRIRLLAGACEEVRSRAGLAMARLPARSVRRLHPGRGCAGV